MIPVSSPTSNASTPAPFDPPRFIAAATAWLRDRLEASGQERFIMGLSGGIDSAVVAALALRAVGPPRLWCVAMPAQYPTDAATSPATSLQDARAVVAALNDRVETRTTSVPLLVAPIAPVMVEAWWTLESAMHQAPGWGDRSPWSQITQGNMHARLRAVMLRGVANAARGLVLGTENRTEHLLGYFTIGGDEETDLEVLTSCYKTDVYALAAALELPIVVRTKAPTADLWEGQTDEAELGVTYAAADAILRALDAGCPPGALAAQTGRTATEVAAVLARMEATAFKRAPRPTFPGVSGVAR